MNEKTLMIAGIAIGILVSASALWYTKMQNSSGENKSFSEQNSKQLSNQTNQENMNNKNKPVLPVGRQASAYTIIDESLKITPPTEEEVKSLTDEAEKKVAVIETDKGIIKFKFYPKDAPYTVASFIKLAQRGFYDGLVFHRVVPGFVIQGGDPLGNGTGGPGYNIKAEFNSQKHLTGTVAMARAQDPNSAGSQFYLTLAPQPFLDNQYTVFGQVILGMDTISKIQIGDKMKKVFLE